MFALLVPYASREGKTYTASENSKQVPTFQSERYVATKTGKYKTQLYTMRLEGGRE